MYLPLQAMPARSHFESSLPSFIPSHRPGDLRTPLRSVPLASADHVDIFDFHQQAAELQALHSSCTATSPCGQPGCVQCKPLILRDAAQLYDLITFHIVDSLRNPSPLAAYGVTISSRSKQISGRLDRAYLKLLDALTSHILPALSRSRVTHALYMDLNTTDAQAARATISKKRPNLVDIALLDFDLHLHGLLLTSTDPETLNDKLQSLISSSEYDLRVDVQQLNKGAPSGCQTSFHSLKHWIAYASKGALSNVVGTGEPQRSKLFHSSYLSAAVNTLLIGRVRSWSSRCLRRTGAAIAAADIAAIERLQSFLQLIPDDTPDTIHTALNILSDLIAIQPERQALSHYEFRRSAEGKELGRQHKIKLSTYTTKLTALLADLHQLLPALFAHLIDYHRSHGLPSEANPYMSRVIREASLALQLRDQKAFDQLRSLQHYFPASFVPGDTSHRLVDATQFVQFASLSLIRVL